MDDTLLKNFLTSGKKKVWKKSMFSRTQTHYFFFFYFNKNENRTWNWLYFSRRESLETFWARFFFFLITLKTQIKLSLDERIRCNTVDENYFTDRGCRNFEKSMKVSLSILASFLISNISLSLVRKNHNKKLKSLLNKKKSLELKTILSK